MTFLQLDRRRLIVAVAVVLLLAWPVGYRSLLVAPDTLLFRTAVDADVYLETSLPDYSGNDLEFVQGGIVADRPGLTDGLTPMFTDAEGGLTLYSYRAGAPLCSAEPGLCDGRKGGFVLRTDATQPPMLTGSYAQLSTGLADFSVPQTLHVASPERQALYTVAIGRKLARPLHVEPNGRAPLDVHLLKQPALRLVPYGVAAILALAVAAYLLSDCRRWEAIGRVCRNAGAAGAVLACWSTVNYLLLFPGLYTSDSVLHRVFTDWYSGLYFILVSMVMSVDRQLTQLPQAIALLAAFILALDTIALACKAFPWRRRILQALFAIAVLFNPAIFAAMEVQQRYFFAATVLMLGLVCTLRTATVAVSSGRGATDTLPLTGLTLVFIAATMRVEYTVFAASIAAFAVAASMRRLSAEQRAANIHFDIVATALAAVAGLIWIPATAVAVAVPLWSLWRRRRRPVPLGRGARGLLTVLIAVAAIRSGSASLAPLLNGWDPDTSALRYGMATTIAIAKPYIACDRPPQTELELSIESYGGVASYCSDTPEVFLWAHAMATFNGLPAERLREFNRALAAEVAANPWPAIAWQSSNAIDALRQPYWQLGTLYDRRDEIAAGKITPNNWLQVSDRFRMQQAFPQLETQQRAEVSFYRWLSGMRPGIGAIGAIATALALVFLATSGWPVGVLSLLMLCLLPPVAMALPTPNPAYFVFLPLWAPFAWVLGPALMALRLPSLRRSALALWRRKAGEPRGRTMAEAVPMRAMLASEAGDKA